MLGALMALVTV